MSIWTSKPTAAALLVAALLLGGCGGLGPLRRAPTGPPPQQQVAVTSDQIIVTGPDGFCVDPTSTTDQGTSAFVLMGNCAVISDRRSAGQPDVPAVLTASVSDAGLEQTLRDSIPELTRFFQTEEGRELLSRGGDASSVEILDSFHQDDVFYLHARDSSTGEIEDVSDEYWRSYLDVGPRIATLTVLGTEGSEMTPETALATLRQFTGAVSAANNQIGGTTVPTAVPAAAPVETVTQPAPNGALWNVGLFRRIMGQ